MPCHDPLTDIENKEYRRLVPILKNRINELTQILCATCRMMEGNHFPIPAELEAWWAEHKAFDEEQKKNE